MDSKDEMEKKKEDILSSVLSEDEKIKIKAQALKELDEENKKKLAQEYKDSIKAEAKKKALLKDAKPGETADGLVPIFIDLPKVAECIRLDGVAFYPGRTYNVTPQQREVILECMHRGQTHEDIVSGRKDPNQYRNKNPMAVR